MVVWRLAENLLDRPFLLEVDAVGHAVLVARTLRVRAVAGESGRASGVGPPGGDVRGHGGGFDLDGANAAVVDRTLERLCVLADVRDPVARSLREIETLPAIGTALAGVRFPPVDELAADVRESGSDERDGRHAPIEVPRRVKPLGWQRPISERDRQVRGDGDRRVS